MMAARRAAVAVGVALLVAASQATTVWLIPHSHCDVGWLKTIEEYYEDNVRSIYTTVFQELPKSPDRRFIIVEMAFFSMWWDEATQAQKDVVNTALANGQIEFVLGGWSMNDDAGPTYSGSANQLTEGHSWIRQHFNVTPEIGWQIDPFGLSSFYPTMDAMMGFNAHVINRIHFQLKDQWKASKHLQFLWRGSDSLGQEVEMFTHVLDSHYSFPSGFNFEKDAPISEANLPSRANTLVNELKKRANWYRSSHLLVPGGDDFRWQNAALQYDNWDMLIEYINARADTYGLTIRYATLSEYFAAVAEEEIEWPVYTDDFFPYADNADSYWTGYFTTHSELKGLIRDTQSLHRTTEMFAQSAAIVTRSSPTDPELLLPLRRAQAEAQHHDGVTGTSKMPVIDMYRSHLAEGADHSEQAAADAFAALLGEEIFSADELAFEGALDALPRLAPGMVVPIVVSNSLGWPVRAVHSINVTRADIVVKDDKENTVPAQIIVIPDTDEVFELAFEVDLPPAGYRIYYITLLEGASKMPVENETPVPFGSAAVMENDYVSVMLEPIGDHLRISIYQYETGVNSTFEAQVYEYHSYSGSGQKSGAYIFRPAGPAVEVAATSSSLVTGAVVDELRLWYGPTRLVTARLVKRGDVHEQRGLSLRLRLGVLDLDREVILRLRTDLDETAAVLFTDNNGIELRARPEAPAAGGPLAANYFPAVSRAELRDTERSLVLISDRTVGVGSQARGDVEAMLHRRCAYDDSRGMGEPLDDRTIARPRLFVIADSAAAADAVAPTVTLRAQYRPRHIATTRPIANGEWAQVRAQYSLLRQPLPENVHLMTVKTDVAARWASAVVRVQNIYETARGGKATEIDLAALIDAQYTVSEELELTATQPLGAVDRLAFSAGAPQSYKPMTTADAVATLRPMDIRTYRFTFAM